MLVAGVWGADAGSGQRPRLVSMRATGGGAETLPTVAVTPPQFTGKISLLGVADEGSRVVIIMDKTVSVAPVFDRMQAEIMKCLENLHEPQSYAVLAFSNDVVMVSGDDVQRLTKGTLEATKQALADLTPGGVSLLDPPPQEQAFRKAFALRANVIYLVTDGKVDASVLEGLEKLNQQKKTRIHCLALPTLEAGAAGSLQRLARLNGGMFRQLDKDLVPMAAVTPTTRPTENVVGANNVAPGGAGATSQPSTQPAVEVQPEVKRRTNTETGGVGSVP
jgi:hypothetical protein